MKCVIAAILSIATAAAAATQPCGSGHCGSLSKSSAIREHKEACGSGQIACCDEVKNMKADGVLGNLLGDGILKTLLGSSDSACAKTDLIDELGILSLVRHTDRGPICSATIACCEGSGPCIIVQNDNRDHGDHRDHGQDGLGEGLGGLGGI